MLKRKQLKRLIESTKESFKTIVGNSTVVHGRVVIHESVRIDGQVIGNIEAHPEKEVTVALGRSALVKGDIHARDILIAGTVEGNIYAAERVELHAGACITGDITYGTIVMEGGAKLNGLMHSRGATEPASLSELGAAAPSDYFARS
jgi:cytoskeletal protein CcmA (bactofilin family)